MRLLSAIATVAMVAVHGQGFKPVPRVQAVPLPGHQISFQHDEREVARFYYGPDLIRPFIYPINGPSGRTLTRMGHPGDPEGHSHHNSVWFALSNVNGSDFWSDAGGGRIRHRRVEQLGDGDDSAFSITEADWIGKDGSAILRERRTIVVKPLTDGQWLLTMELRLEAAQAPAVITKENFGPIGVRVAKSLSAFFGGGTLRSSEGGEGEPAIFRKPARWVDYSGQVANGIVEGLTLLDHPANPNHPAPFHVREDGWMGAMLALADPYVLEPGKPLQLRYGLYVHRGVPDRAAIEVIWRAFARDPLRTPYGPPVNAEACRHGEFRRFTVPRGFASQQDCADFVKSGK